MRTEEVLALCWLILGLIGAIGIAFDDVKKKKLLKDKQKAIRWGNCIGYIIMVALGLFTFLFWAEFLFWTLFGSSLKKD